MEGRRMEGTSQLPPIPGIANSTSSPLPNNANIHPQLQTQHTYPGQQKRELTPEEETVSPVPLDNNVSKKRRTASSNTGNGNGNGGGGSISSSRGVANLTPDQLAKKRANDREAQRAIRERTKNQIENLERKIKELTSQQPYQELQHALRQKETVEAENIDIKKRLNSVLLLIQPVMGQHGIEAPNHAQQPYLTRPGSSSNIHTAASNNASPAMAARAPSPWQQAPSAPMMVDPRYPPLQRTYSAQIQQVAKQQDMVHSLDMGPERLGLDFLLDSTQRIPKLSNGINGIHDSANSYSHHTQQQQQHQQQRSERSSPTRRRSGSASSHANYAPSPTHDQVQGHNAPIRNGPATCPLDSLLLDFLHERQQQAADGVDTPKLVGPAYPSVSSLLNPARGSTSHPLSKVFTDILATFPDLSTLPEKVAVLYIMFLVMRWQIAPTQENYDRLPDWMTPRPSQLFTAHPAWIDHLPFPKMRDRLVRSYNPRDYLFDNFFIPFTTTLCLNWPYEPTDTLLSVNGEDGELVINPVFERHLRRLENWSLGSAFAGAFPGLEGTYMLKVEGDRRA